jgi:hypothetical protein
MEDKPLSKFEPKENLADKIPPRPLVAGKGGVPPRFNVYHGTNADIKDVGQLDPALARNKNEPATFFTRDPAEAKGYGSNVLGGSLDPRHGLTVNQKMFDFFAARGDPVRGAIDYAKKQFQDYVEFDLPSGKSYGVINKEALKPLVPEAPKPQSSLPGQVMSDASPDPIRAGQQYAANLDPSSQSVPARAPQRFVESGEAITGGGHAKTAPGGGRAAIAAHAAIGGHSTAGYSPSALPGAPSTGGGWMPWYLDGILISSDYMTAPSVDSGAMIGARPGFGGFRPRHPTATRGRFPGHRDAVRRGAEREGHSGEVAGPGPHGLPTQGHVDLEHTDAELVARMRAAYEAAPAEAKKGFAVISGYRSVEEQAEIYERSGHGRLFAAAPPGRSKHQRGEALDIEDPTGWFHQHGHEFGLHWPVPNDYPHTQMDPNFGRRLSSPQASEPAGAVGPGAVRGSMFDDTRTASGRSAATEAGIALPSGGQMGDQYKITTPDGRTFIAPLIDRGPAAWTGRGVDISRPLAEKMGYGRDFPTDKHFKVEPYTPEPTKPPEAPQPQSSLPGQVMSDATPDPIRPGQQYAMVMRPDPALEAIQQSKHRALEGEPGKVEIPHRPEDDLDFDIRQDEPREESAKQRELYPYNEKTGEYEIPDPAPAPASPSARVRPKKPHRKRAPTRRRRRK